MQVSQPPSPLNLNTWILQTQIHVPKKSKSTSYRGQAGQGGEGGGPEDADGINEGDL